MVYSVFMNSFLVLGLGRFIPKPTQILLSQTLTPFSAIVEKVWWLLIAVRFSIFIFSLFPFQNRFWVQLSKSRER